MKPPRNKRITPQEARTKKQLEKLLKKHRYTHDDRPDHREWWKTNSAFAVDIRLDQNNTDGLNGFEAHRGMALRQSVPYPYRQRRESGF